jgi:hypothetical protein
MPTPKQYADALSATPRNSWKYLADAMQPVSEFADTFKVKQDVPLVGGMSAADFTGLKGAFGLADDASYGKYPIRGASLQTAKVDPRVIDAMGLAGALMPVAKNVGKAALREGARQIETGTGIGRVVLDPRMEIVPNNISKFPKTDGEIRSEIAQRNAALPISEGGLGLPANNMPMDRANAPDMFQTDAYHGGNSDIQQIDKKMFGSSTGAESGKKAFWAVDNPTVARGYADYAANDAPVAKILKDAEFQGKVAQRTGNHDKYENLVIKAEELVSAIQANPLRGQNIMPLRINTKNSSVMDAGGESFPYAENDINKFLNKARQSGNDVAQIKNLDDAVGRVDLPANHYAIFNPANIRSRFAAFDPFRRHEADILAGVGIGGMLNPESVSEEFRKKDKK